LLPNPLAGLGEGRGGEGRRRKREWEKRRKGREGAKNFLKSVPSVFGDTLPFVI